MQNRRTLHEPFFPQPSSSSTTTPSTPPPSSQPPTPSFPKYPFSSNPQQPFFPDFPSPPPPPPSTSTVPTFPANLSTLIYPNNPSDAAPHHSHTTPRLLPAILLSLIALSLLSLSAAFLFHRRRRSHHRGPSSSPKRSNKPAATSSASAVPPAPPAPPPPPPLAAAAAAAASTATPDFLYLGTFVSNRSVREQIEDKKVIGSPELRPLPPLSLSREFKLSSNNNYQNATAGTDSDDEFYSPKGGSATNGSVRSSSRRNFEAVAAKCGSDLSTPPYPDSNSGTSEPPSPVGSSPRSKNPRSETPPPPPPPLWSMRPLTPSPPKKRKPPSPSPPCSPPVEIRPASKFEFLGQNSRNQAAMPPPPPPPPPPVGYWESQVRKPPMKKPVALKRPIVEVSESSNSVGVSSYNEETMPRAKLKPLHWDKVRASSDRVMVWDQLKSSSFQ